MTEIILCDICGKNEAMHERGSGKKYCCECHVKSGAAPADWHPVCIKTYNELHEQQTKLKEK